MKKGERGRKKDWQRFMTGVVKANTVTVRLPSSFVPFCRVDNISQNAIRLGEWPEKVYAGRNHAQIDERVKDFPRVMRMIQR